MPKASAKNFSLELLAMPTSIHHETRYVFWPGVLKRLLFLLVYSSQIIAININKPSEVDLIESSFDSGLDG